MEHTPGPWIVIESGYKNLPDEILIEHPREGKSNKRICGMGYYGCKNSQEDKANAHLIAAAPNMINLIEKAYLKLLSLGFWEGRATEDGQTLLSNLRDIIADVRGITDEEVQNEFENKAVSKVEGRK